MSVLEDVSRNSAGLLDHIGSGASWQPLLLALALTGAVYAFGQLITLVRRDARQGRINLVRGEAVVVHPPTRSDLSGRLLRRMERLGVRMANSALLGSAERARLSRLLERAGYRRQSSLAILLIGKLIGLVAALGAAWFLAASRQWAAHNVVLQAAVLGAGALLGWRASDYLVGLWATRYQAKIEDALPDALDLLVMCAEAGLSLDQGLIFVGGEIAAAHPALGRELDITSSELRVLDDRRDAIVNFAARTGLASTRSVAAALVQSMKYGTPLVETLRVLAAEMRSARLLRIEEKAARLPVLLSIPLVAFLLPCTFIVLLGPSVLRIADALSRVSLPPVPSL
jgi:tight adherence protein C